MHPAVAKLSDKDRRQFGDIAAGKMDCQQASKDTLVAVCRVLSGSGGDYDRTPRLEYVKRVQELLTQGGDTARGTLAAANTADSSAVPPPPVATTAPTAPAVSTAGTAVPNAGALTALAEALKALGIGGIDPQQVRDLVDAHIGDVAERIKEAVAKETRRVTLVTPNLPDRDAGVQHVQFPDLLRAMNARKFNGDRLNIFLAGPPGSGKTHACEAAAELLGMQYAFNGAIDTEYKLLGFTDAMGRVVSRPFRKIFAEGGVYLFDEVDGSMPAALLALNAALANGQCDFPDGMVRRHPDAIIVAAGNTYGFGATAEFVGRNKMDGASRDRFTFMPWAIDEALERKLALDSDWCAYVQKCRAIAATKGLKVIISPRATQSGEALLSVGFTRKQAAAMTMFAGMSAEQVAMFPAAE